MAMGKDSVDLIPNKTSDTSEVVESWDSEEEEDTMNRNSCEM